MIRNGRSQWPEKGQRSEERDARLCEESDSHLLFRGVVPGECRYSTGSSTLRLVLGDQDSSGKHSSRFPKCPSTSLTHCRGGPRRVGLIFSSPLTQRSRTSHELMLCECWIVKVEFRALTRYVTRKYFYGRNVVESLDPS